MDMVSNCFVCKYAITGGGYTRVRANYICGDCNYRKNSNVMYKLWELKFKKASSRYDTIYKYMRSKEERQFRETEEEKRILDQCRETAISVTMKVFEDEEKEEQEFEALLKAIEMVKQDKGLEDIDFVQPGRRIDDAEMKKVPFCYLSQEQADRVQLLPLVLHLAAKNNETEDTIKNGVINTDNESDHTAAVDTEQVPQEEVVKEIIKPTIEETAAADIELGLILDLESARTSTKESVAERIVRTAASARPLSREPQKMM